MDFSQVEKSPVKKFGGLAFVIFLHLFIVYALVTGLARKVVDVIKQPLETKIIEEMKKPPPPDVPPPPPPPKLLAPPPPFIPPPEVQISQPTPVNTISQVSNVQPDNPVMPAARAPEAPPSTTGAVNVPAVVDFNTCAKPEYPRNSQRNEETGTVTLSFLIGLDGRVVDSKIEKSSGFKDLDKTARSALSLCKFKPGTIDGKPQQSWTKVQYVWKLE